MYVEPKDYFPEEVRKEYELGEYNLNEVVESHEERLEKHKELSISAQKALAASERLVKIVCFLLVAIIVAVLVALW